MKKNKVKWNVLVFPGGMEIGLEIHKSLSALKEVKLFSAANNVINHAPYVYKNHYIVSDIFNPEKCINDLNKIIEENKINYIFPGNVLVMDFLADHCDQINCRMVMSEVNIIKIIRSKKRTYEYFKNIFPTPEVYTLEQNEKINFPVFIKPDNLYGGAGGKIINNTHELSLSIEDNYVITEYLPGYEYTIECFSTQKDGLMFCLGRSRERVRMGTSMHSEIASNSLQSYFYEIATMIFTNLKITGAWFFQMKEDKDKTLKLLEIEGRIAGTMALNRVRGINFSLLSLYEKDGININLLENKNMQIIIDRALTNRYKHDIEYDTLYIDLDDTLIVKDKINITLIRLIYQAINERKKVILITKFLGDDVSNYLSNYKLLHLFDDIIWLKEEDSKADYIDPEENPIFIDDSFSQRKEVYEQLGIPTFDNSMIEVLLDERNI